jgi:isoquinoline 1-oxidoreductase alpha subunit
MSAVALAEVMKAQKRIPTDEEINVAMSGNLCRCGTYPRIREAIKEAVAELIK